MLLRGLPFVCALPSRDGAAPVGCVGSGGLEFDTQRLVEEELLAISDALCSKEMIKCEAQSLVTNRCLCNRGPVGVPDCKGPHRNAALEEAAFGEVGKTAGCAMPSGPVRQQAVRAVHWRDGSRACSARLRCAGPAQLQASSASSTR